MSTTLPLGEFRNHPPTDFSRPSQREAFLRGLQQAQALFPADIPLLINGKRLETGDALESHNPSRFSQLIARTASAAVEHVDQAAKVARDAHGPWSRRTAEDRAAILIAAAELMAERKYLLAGVIVHESGKPWREADADVDEAIDFLQYYAREMARLGRPRRLQNYLLGEHNDLVYQSLGVVGVIGPWNFPLAIPVGMAGAALAAGNTVLLKPAEQTPLIAWLWVRIMEEAGLPPGVLNFLPGPGETCGARIVSHPDVNMIVFTGSREVGLHIIREASVTHPGQHFVKRVVTEMGGKNGLIVDSSADLDSSVPDAIYSAFGFAGQKCSALSRLILVQDVYEEYLERLREGVDSLKIGLPELPGTQVGPVIDREAAAKISGYIELGRGTARTIHIADVGPLAQTGHFIPPAIFAVDSHDHRLAQEEIFGPVLTVLRARNFDEALRIANASPYALTGGVHSRTPANLSKARNEFQAGNLYLNRSITGAIVGRQPFGGYRLSGIGSKAGGPDYLKQFLVARVISENMMRHGMASLVEAPPEAAED